MRSMSGLQTDSAVPAYVSKRISREHDPAGPYDLFGLLPDLPCLLLCYDGNGNLQYAAYRFAAANQNRGLYYGRQCGQLKFQPPNPRAAVR